MEPNSSTDLAAYAALSEEIAALGSDDAWRDLQPSDFPDELADRLPFEGLVIDRPLRRIVGRADRPRMPFEIQDVGYGHDWYAEPEGYRRVGLWLFHLLFSGRDFAGLTLGHDQSRIAELWVAVERPAAHGRLLKFDRHPRAISYDYYPSAPPRHPFSGDDRVASDAERPMFRFGWSEDGARFKADPSEADQVIVAVTPDGLAAFAALLLDFAMPWSECNELNLEPPFIGCAGTRPLSLEARFWLPGSFAFHSASLDELALPENS